MVRYNTLIQSSIFPATFVPAPPVVVHVSSGGAFIYRLKYRGKNIASTLKTISI